MIFQFNRRYRLLRRYRGRTDLALSFYNGGSRVGRWPNARVIPATRAYVAKVQRLERRYRQQLTRGRLSFRVPPFVSYTDSQT